MTALLARAKLSWGYKADHALPLVFLFGSADPACQIVFSVQRKMLAINLSASRVLCINYITVCSVKLVNDRKNTCYTVFDP